MTNRRVSRMSRRRFSRKCINKSVRSKRRTKRTRLCMKGGSVELPPKWKCHECTDSIGIGDTFVKLSTTGKNDTKVAGALCNECSKKTKYSTHTKDWGSRPQQRQESHKYPKYIGQCKYCEKKNIYTGLNGKYNANKKLIICDECRAKKVVEVTGYRIVPYSDPKMSQFKTITLSK